MCSDRLFDRFTHLGINYQILEDERACDFYMSSDTGELMASIKGGLTVNVIRSGERITVGEIMSCSGNFIYTEGDYDVFTLKPTGLNVFVLDNAVELFKHILNVYFLQHKGN